MNELEAVWALSWRDLVRFVRDRGQIMGAFARPLLWLIFMGKGLSASPAGRHGESSAVRAGLGHDRGADLIREGVPVPSASPYNL